MKQYKICRIRCKKCGDVLEHDNATRAAEILRCQCGAVGLDPDDLAPRIIAESRGAFEDLSA